MNRSIVLAISLGLIWTASPALAQDAQVPEEPSDHDTSSGLADAPPVTAGPGFLARVQIPAAPPMPAEPASPGPAELMPPGLAPQTAPPHAARRGKPPLGGGRVAGELALGVALGSALAFASGAAAYWAMDRDDPDNLADAFAPALGAVVIGVTAYPLGVGLGVSWVGNAGDQAGSTAAAVGGAYAGAFGGALLAGFGYFAGAPLGATIAFNRTRRYDAPATGLINVGAQQTQWSMPAISVTRDPLHTRGKITSVRLLDARF